MDVQRQIGRLLYPLPHWFVADCVANVLPYFEEAYPHDERPRLAVETIRGFLSGTIHFDAVLSAREELLACGWCVNRHSPAARVVEAAVAACTVSWPPDWHAFRFAAWSADRAAPDQDFWQADRLAELHRLATRSPLKELLPAFQMAHRDDWLPIIADALQESGYVPVACQWCNDP